MASRGAPDLYAVTGGGLDLVAAIAAACAAGLGWVQVREKHLPPRELLAFARAVVRAAAPFGSRVLVNDRADIAVLAGAHGVHLSEGSVSAAEIRATFPDLLVGASVHGLERARAAAADGADFVVFGPVFDTPSKRDFGEPQGLFALTEVVTQVGVPVVAIGGIGPGEVASCLAAGARGVAAIRGLLGVGDVTAVAAAVGAYRRALGFGAMLAASRRRR